jgi:hypothetical protein
MAQLTKQAGPLDRLKAEASGLAGALAERAVSSATERLTGTTERLTEYAESGGGAGLTAALTGAKGLAEGKSPTRSLLGAGMSGLKEKVSGLFGGGKGGKGGNAKKIKVTNIYETADVGVPVRVAYNQWTEFGEFPTFMKKVENVEQAEDAKLNWKAQIFWSHRTWEATIIEQQPEDKIVWRSKGEKGHVDGAVTFHELAPNLTRIVLILEYHPQGLFERTGNIWRAQGRRARLEFKHFVRHVMTQTILHPDEVEGWRGVISDGEVVKDHETALEEERSADGQASGEDDEDRAPDDETDEDSRDRAAQDDESDEDYAESDEDNDEDVAADGRVADEEDGQEPDEETADGRTRTRTRRKARTR